MEVPHEVLHSFSLWRLGTSFRGSAAAWESLAAEIPGKLPSFLELFFTLFKENKNEAQPQPILLFCFIKKKKKAFVEKCLENFFLKISSVLKDSYSFGTKRYTDELMWCSTSQFPAVLGFEYTALVTYRQGRSLLINYRG